MNAGAARLPAVRCSTCTRVIGPALQAIDDLFSEGYERELRLAYGTGATEYDDDAEDRLLTWEQRIRVRVMNAILNDRPDEDTARIRAALQCERTSFKLPACCRVKMAAYVQHQRAPNADEDGLDDTMRHVPGIKFKTARQPGPRVYKVSQV